MTSLIRAALRPRVRPILLTTAGATLLCSAFVLGRTVSRPEIVVTPPVIVPAPQVTVAPAPVVMPPTPVVVQAPTPPEPPPAPPAPQPRALVPTLDAGCVMNLPGSAASPTCAWDDGFPAISADGALIATKYSPPMGGADVYGLSIHFIDTRTSRVVRDSVIVTPDELGAVLYPPGAAVGGPLDDKQLQQYQRLLSTIHRRVAGVQRTLDARQFRTLHLLGSARASMSDEVTPSQRGPEPIYAEIVGTTARIIDSATSQVLGRGEFYAAGPRRRDNDASDCSNWAPWSIALWWDPETRQVLALQTYRTGGCMCPDVPTETVQPLR
jgi:hypothetical protein